MTTTAVTIRELTFEEIELVGGAWTWTSLGAAMGGGAVGGALLGGAAGGFAGMGAGFLAGGLAGGATYLVRDMLEAAARRR